MGGGALQPATTATTAAARMGIPAGTTGVRTSATMAAVREGNYVFRPTTREQWLAMFGR